MWHRGKHISSVQLAQGSGDGHKTAMGGIVLSGRETVEPWPRGRREAGAGGKGLEAGLCHSWQLCQ